MARAIRNDLESASSLLHKVADGVPLSAGDSLRAVMAVAAVDAILKPGGWTHLRAEEGAFTTNLPLTMRSSLRDALKAAGEEKRETLSSLVAEGYQEVLDGTWVPPESRRTVRRGASGHAGARVVLNVTVDDQLRKDLRERLPALAEELGYKVTEGGIATAYLKHKLGVTVVSETDKAE